ncbi:hypothetical protein SMD20_05505 [Nonomuraea sp. LP-02]|uniref:hypothetical protein n=1 Tax=Nonomuraea sp. LP-02 TaxID=3097960 RepID=UPI002E2F653B|nr:hypothetical protein [Nonomuraea sp. LP-02]MED7923674.1 hypothetical protein [Nonomuraea sp. LP-02]
MPHPDDPPQDDAARRRRGIDQVSSVLGCVCAAVAVLYAPVLFGLAGIVLGIVGHLRGEPLGKWAAPAAGVGMGVGTVLTLVLESVR